MGRKTYEPGLKIDLSSPYPTLEQYVPSTTMEESPDENVTLVSGDAAGPLGGLKSEPGKDIWLAGGATLAASLLSEGLVDALMLKFNPVVLGSGIPLFSGGTKNVDLDLEDGRTLAGGVALLRYRVKNWGRTIHRYLPAQQDFLPGYGMPGMSESPPCAERFLMP
jgi:dihydrofolate reductase